MPVSEHQPMTVHDGRANPNMPELAMTQYLLFFMAFAASAAAPGPEIAGLLSRSLSGGIASSVPLAVGIIAGKLLMLTAAIVGLTALLTVLGGLPDLARRQEVAQGWPGAGGQRAGLEARVRH